jgi:hypothetical protein
VNTTNTSWHKFDETEDGDEQCTRCRVIVSVEAQMTFSIPCPAGDCSASRKNPDDHCVFVPRHSGPSCCIYCGRQGDREPLPEDLLEEFAAGLIPLSDYLDAHAWADADHGPEPEEED